MITLSKSGSTVTFTFDENSGYLQNGTIDVPVNSLSLVIDDSDMATFKKSASNDIFISARYEEFGMSKAELEAWYKANIVSSGGGGGGGGVTSGEVQTMIDESISGLAESSAVTEEISEAVSGKVDTSAFTAFSGDVQSTLDEIETVAGAAFNDLNDRMAEKLDASAYTPVDLSDYYTTAQTDSKIAEAVSGKASQSDLETVSGQVANKQDQLVSGTNIKTINNISLLGSGNIDIQGGGGTTYTAGRGIDITNDTISVSLPISAGTGVDSVLLGYTHSSSSWMPKATSKGAIAAGASVSAMSECSFAFGYKSKTTGGTTKKYNFAHGYNTIANGAQSHAEGTDTISNGANSHADGKGTIANNDAEHASGQYNVSNSATTTFGDSGNTLFSVGNGTADNARHNAFEIRQNGDIYLNDGTNDVKLQDYLQIKAVKVTQAEYDALVTKDSNTLYVIVN